MHITLRFRELSFSKLLIVSCSCSGNDLCIAGPSVIQLLSAGQRGRLSDIHCLHDRAVCMADLAGPDKQAYSASGAEHEHWSFNALLPAWLAYVAAALSLRG